MDSRSFLFVLSVSSVLLVGCGSPIVDSETPSDTVALNTTEGTTYENTRFGYRFIVPDGALVYALNLEGQTARLAEPQDEIVFVVGDGSNVLTIRGIDGEVSSHQWLTDHVTFFYPTGEAAQQIQELDGRQALALYGDGSSGSPARILVVQNGEQLIVITFEQEAEVFDRILTSFSFIL